mgnify:CR=1 FL=1|tara:strand:+ start:572 stop:1078 length:507 start_codon:yes stop_codon:yes gene_type:complete
MENMRCKCTECKFVITPYIPKQQHHHNNSIRKYKSGILLYNPKTKSILIVQSRGNMWGFPKGSLEQGENFKECALREFREETGIVMKEDILDVTKEFKVNHFVKYYFVDTKREYNDIGINDDVNNDANGICWIKLDCLRDMMINNDLKFNYHARCCLFHYFGISKNSI